MLARQHQLAAHIQPLVVLGPVAALDRQHLVLALGGAAARHQRERHGAVVGQPAQRAVDPWLQQVQRRLVAPPLLEHRLAPGQRALARREALDLAREPPALQGRMHPLGRLAIHWAGLDAMPLADPRDQVLRGGAGDLGVEGGEQVVEHVKSPILKMAVRLPRHDTISLTAPAPAA